MASNLTMPRLIMSFRKARLNPVRFLERNASRRGRSDGMPGMGRWSSRQKPKSVPINDTIVPSSMPASKTAAGTSLNSAMAVQPLAAVFQLLNPIGFDAPDELPVTLMIFLLVPEAATQKHLEILSEIAELLSDSALREQMKGSDDAVALHGLISNWQSAHATV